MSDRHDGNRYYPAEEDLRFPPLTPEEEIELFRKAKTDDDARTTIITRHLLYALKLGRRFSGKKLPVDETTSAANEALMIAVDRFDCERGFRFRSFLVPYVRAAIAKCWRARSPVDFKHGEPPIEVPLDLLSETSGRGEGSRKVPRLPLELTEASPIEQNDHDGFLKGELAACADTLPERDREVIRLHYVEGFNLAEIGKKLSLSRERVRQIHATILVALKARLEKRGIKRTQ